MRAIISKTLLFIFTILSLETLPVQAQDLAAIAAVQQLGTTLNEAINSLNGHVSDQLATSHTDLEEVNKELNDLTDKLQKGIIHEGDQVIQNTLRKATRTMFDTANQLQLLRGNANNNVQAAIISEAKVLADIPFIHIEPFISLGYPSKLMLSNDDTYPIQLIGYWGTDLPVPRVKLPDGTRLNVMRLIGNEVEVSIPRVAVEKYIGKSIPLSIIYFTKKGWIYDYYQTEGFNISVLPEFPLEYSLSSLTKERQSFETTSVVLPRSNVEASKGTTNNRDISFALSDIIRDSAGNAPDPKVYDILHSHIVRADVTNQGGNHDGTASIDFDGQRVILHLSATGTKDRVERTGPGGLVPQFYGGEGANHWADVKVEFQLAHNKTVVPATVSNGDVSTKKIQVPWGESVDLILNKDDDEQAEFASSTRVDIWDNTKSPPQHIILTRANESYQTPNIDAALKSDHIQLSTLTP